MRKCRRKSTIWKRDVQPPCSLLPSVTRQVWTVTTFSKKLLLFDLINFWKLSFIYETDAKIYRYLHNQAVTFTPITHSMCIVDIEPYRHFKIYPRWHLTTRNFQEMVDLVYARSARVSYHPKTSVVTRTISRDIYCYKEHMWTYSEGRFYDVLCWPRTRAMSSGSLSWFKTCGGQERILVTLCGFEFWIDCQIDFGWLGSLQGPIYTHTQLRLIPCIDADVFVCGLLQVRR